MNFYKDCFGGKLEFMTVGESPMATDMPEGSHDLIMNSTLTSGQIYFSGSDMMRDRAVIGDNVGMALECATEKELNTLFTKLSEGGKVFMAPEEQSWGGVFGMLTDKFGVEWMLNFQKKTAPKKK